MKVAMISGADLRQPLIYLSSPAFRVPYLKEALSWAVGHLLTRKQASL